MSTHPARAHLVAGFSFNVQQLKELEAVCAEAATTTGAGSPWHDRATGYGQMFANRRKELETQLERIESNEPA